MIGIDPENPWIFGGILIGVWILVSIGIAVALPDGDFLSAIVRGGLAGFGFTIAFLYLRRRQ